MILFIYNLALLAALAAGAPWWLWRMATARKYREGLSERLGWVPARLAALGRERPLIWLHAVSVGEVLAASRLAGELDRAFPGHRLVVSTTTRTGQALARERFGSNRVFYCSLDLPWAVRSFLNALQPRLLILAETEFWPNLLSGCFRRGIPVAVVNARISDRSWPRYRLLRGLWRPFLSRLSRVLAQSETDAERLKAIGCLPERVLVVGNLKFDVRAAQEADATRLLKALTSGLRLIVAGSTLEGEEAAILDAWPKLLEADPQLALVLAPRHPERFGAVAALQEKFGLSWVRRSDWSCSTPSASWPRSTLLHPLPLLAVAWFRQGDTIRWNQLNSAFPSLWAHTTPTSAPSPMTCESMTPSVSPPRTAWPQS
jgi:3-deoxy-D-manno-octulosonic-acid transferase